MADRLGRASAQDVAAFHRHIGEINRRRVPRLALGSAVIFAVINGPIIWNNGLQSYYSAQVPAAGFVLCFLVLALHRWSSIANAGAVAYGYAALAWGNMSAGLYTRLLDLGHFQDATSNFTLFFASRYLVAAAVVWRPLHFAIALLLNHALAIVLMGPRGVALSFIILMWTSISFMVSYVLYRSEREKFFAQRAMERQRDALAQANARLEALNQEKNDLMAIAAHDLRSPLMGMVGLLQLTAAEASKAWTAGLRNLRALEDTSQAMADLVTRVLDVHQAGDSLEALSLAVQDVRPLVSKTAAAFIEQAKLKAITLAIDLPAEPCPALHDAHALSRVLDNLSSNAIKFTPPGGSIQLRVTMGRDGGAMISVRDSGPGISEGERSRLFRKFARLNARPTGGEASSGMGLYITKRLVDAMRGSIEVTSVEGAGATFTIALAGALPH